MITCPKCGADNLLNAIFCRTCGEKLDLSQLKPDSVGPSPEDQARLLRQKRQNQIAGGILGVILIVLLGGILIPPGGKMKGAEPSADVWERFETAQGLVKVTEAPAETEKKDKKGKKKKNKKPAIPDADLTFTDEEATNIVNKSMGLLGGTAGGGGNMVANNVSVRFLSTGNVKVILSCTAFNFCPVNYTVEWKPSLSGKGNLSLEDEKPTLGLLPMHFHAELKNFVIQQFNALSGQCGDIGKVRRRLKKVAVEEGKLSITVGE